MRKKSTVILLLLIIAFSSLYSTSNQRILFKYKFTSGEKYSVKLTYDSRYIFTGGKYIKEFTERIEEFETLNVSSNNSVATFRQNFKPCKINGTPNNKFKPFKLVLKIRNTGRVVKILYSPSIYPLFKSNYQNDIIFPLKPISIGDTWKTITNVFDYSEPTKVNVIAKFVKITTYKNKQVALIRYFGKKYHHKAGLFTFDYITLTGMEYFDFNEGKALYKKTKVKYYMPAYHGRKPPLIVTYTYDRIN